jgi:hypothetical protein
LEMDGLVGRFLDRRSQMSGFRAVR